MFRRFVLASICAALVLTALPAVGSATSIAGPNGKIVFASGRASSLIPAPAANDSDARLWVADYPSGTPVQVTTLPVETQHRHPNWSPDHSKIVYAAGKAFSGEYALWIVDLKTGVQTEFVPKAPAQDRPTWSPDGTRIAYGSNGDLWVKNVAPGSTPIQLTATPGIQEERPVWSPDGNTLYYNRGVPPFNAGTKRDLYEKSPVTPGGAETAVLEAATDDWQPAVSPDGSRLCYLRGPQTNEATLRTINVDGNGDTLFRDEATLGDLNCVWSPDGSRILFTEGAFEAGQLRSRDVNGGSFDTLDPFNVESHFDGNADWATNFSPKCEAKNATVGVNAFISISLSCVDPDAGFGKEPPTPTHLDDSAIELASQPAHGTLGGLSNGKVIYTPNKDFKGTDTFSYTGSDGVSNADPATVTIQVTSPPPKKAKGGGTVGDKTAPSISALKLSAKRWRRGKRLATISKAPVGTTISFRLSEAASASVSFQRATRRNGKLRYVNAGSLKPLPAKAGRNRIRFQGRLTRLRTLAVGKYRVVLSARDAAGNRSAPRTGPSFTIVSG
jgi:Tol biopolymer transport system component